MKIVFLCGSLEPGCDGVGDYTRRLAGEIIQQGNQASAVALNDMFTLTTLEETQHENGFFLKVFRIAAKLPVKKRFSLAEEWIKNYAPQWVSVQFVPYAYHAKGLPLHMLKLLGSLGRERFWHFMFHELWVTIDFNKSKKNWVIGNIQRQLIKKLLKNIKPSIIHTQTKHYQRQIHLLNTNVNYLPLFSNIPVYDKNRQKQAKLSDHSKIEIINFGSVYPNSLITDFAREAALYSTKKNVEITLTLVGRYGTEHVAWVYTWESLGMKVNLLGERSSEEISKILAKATFGITSTPLALIEKSGTVAAMKEHALPVVCISEPWVPKGHHIELPEGVVEYTKGNFEECLINRKNNYTYVNVSNVAKQLIDEFSFFLNHPKTNHHKTK